MAQMHEGEVRLSDALVRELLDEQFPSWAALPLRRVASGGTSNALYRLGEDLGLRLPLIDWAAGDANKEARYLPLLARHLPLPIPAPLALGRPTARYPFSWSVTPWLRGDDAFQVPPGDLMRMARDMASFIEALQSIPVVDPPPPGRGGPLAPRDSEVQTALAQLEGEIDVGAAARAWGQSLAAPVFDGAPVWLHADLHPGNLLVTEGRLSGVIDWGALSTGDPATELLFAWMVLDAPARELFRKLLSVDEPAWLRGRGWALSMALIALPYYRASNRVLAEVSRRAITEILSTPL